jgi:hypothetical protein
MCPARREGCIDGRILRGWSEVQLRTTIIMLVMVMDSMIVDMVTTLCGDPGQ